MADVKILNAKGYHDGYYWDYRVWFEYAGEKYTYIDVGSYSGYVSCFISIAKGVLELPEGPRDEECIHDLNAESDEFYEVLIGAALELKNSGEDEYVLLDD